MSPNQALFLKTSPALPYVEMRSASHSSACYRAHSHDEFSFGVIDRGRADYHNRQHKNRVGAGVTVTINPGDVHACNPSTNRWSYRMLFMEAAWLGRLQQELTGTSQDYEPFPTLFETSAQTYQQFHRLFATLEHETNLLLAEGLLVEFLQPHFAAPDRSATITTRHDQPGLAAVRELIMDQLDHNLSLDTLCRVANLSRYQLIRRFKQAYGQTPHAYQLDQRIKKAKSLLRQPDYSVNAVAHELGFSDQAHFQRHFKQRLAITPGQYRSFFKPEPAQNEPME